MKEINRDFKSTFHLTHFCLSSLTYYNSNTFAAEESLIEDWDFRRLLLGEIGSEVISSLTLDLLNNFRLNWLKYKRSANYAGDPVFMYFDINWHQLIEEYLIPALDSMELDFNYYGLEYVPYSSHYNPSIRPSVENILERGTTLYKLLLKNGITEKPYMK